MMTKLLCKSILITLFSVLIFNTLKAQELSINGYPVKDFPVINNNQGWTFNYEQKFNKKSYAVWRQLELSARGWKQHKKYPYICGYNGDITLKINAPGPITQLSAEAKIANYTDRKNRKVIISYSNDGANFKPIAEKEFGGGAIVISGSIKVTNNKGELWLRFSRVLKRNDKNGKRGYVVFKSMSFKATGINAIKNKQAQTSSKAPSGRAGDDFQMIKSGKPVASIEVPAKAAKEFNSAMEIYSFAMRIITGTTLPTQAVKDGNVIRWDILPGEDLATRDAFSISFPDRNTMLIKATPFSIQWALNYILETSTDMRYLFQGARGMAYKPLKDVSIPRKDISRGSSFPLLHQLYAVSTLGPQWGISAVGIKQNHELANAVFPAAKYNKIGWPQDIMPTYKGKKIVKPPHRSPQVHWQPCFSNPKTAEIAIANILEWLHKHPGAISIGLGINDNGPFCQCDACIKANGAKGKSYNNSEVYYKWVNKVTEGVCKEYPNIYFGLLAYCQTLYAPSFKLHPNVVPVLTIDLFACKDPKTMKRHKKNIVAWSKKATQIGVWDYMWGYPYWIPRVYFKHHAKMLKFLHKHNCRAYFGQPGPMLDGLAGPKDYLVAQLLKDINTNADSVLEDWYIHCVGKKAAPWLKKYYEKCEAFYDSAAIKKTAWWRSRSSAYMSFYDDCWKNAITQEDLIEMRSFMENVVKLAGTDQEKTRARLFMRHFEFAEARMKLCGAESIPANGQVSNADTALTILKKFNTIHPYVKRWKEIMIEMSSSPKFGKRYISRRIISPDGDGSLLMIEALVKTVAYKNDPIISAQFKKIAQDEALPEKVRRVARAFSDVSTVKNLFTNSGFKEKLDATKIKAKVPYRRTSEVHCKGKYSIEVQPGFFTDFSFNEPLSEGTYLVFASVYMKNSNPEAYLDLRLWSTTNGRRAQWNNLEKGAIPGGMWKDFVAMTTLTKKRNGADIVFKFGGFMPGKKVYIADITLFKLQ